MLSNVTLSFEAYQSLPASDDRWLMQCLVRYVDRTGRCWPSLRTLARDALMHLSTVQRHLAALESLGCFTRYRRPGGSYVYQLAERFLPVWATKKPPADSPEEVSHPCDGVSHLGETEGLPKKDSQDFKTIGDPVRREAPPVVPDAAPEHPRRGHTKPAEGPNPFARRQWLRKLNAFISTRLSGPQQWLGWELIAKAEKGALIDRAERRQLDDIDRAMRACGYRPGAT